MHWPRPPAICPGSGRPERSLSTDDDLLARRSRKIVRFFQVFVSETGDAEDGFVAVMRSSMLDLVPGLWPLVAHPGGL